MINSLQNCIIYIFWGLNIDIGVIALLPNIPCRKIFLPQPWRPINIGTSALPVNCPLPRHMATIERNLRRL